MIRNYADERELKRMVNELLGIQYNIAKANRTDRRVQNLASYINADSLRAIHKTMDKRKAYGIDKVTKEDYEQNLEENLANLVKRMKSGSYRPNPTRRVYIPKETKGKMRPLGITGIQAETGRTLWEIWTGTGGRKDEDYRIREVCQAKPKSKRRKKTRYL